MRNLKNYLSDGANHQARAVLMLIQPFNIEESWSSEYSEYLAEIKVSRWENCREQGYVLSLRSLNYDKQLNIAFFEHRNSDGICAVKWEQITLNSPTIDTSDFGDIYKDKWDTSYSVNYGQILEMSEWITEQLESFWLSTSVKK